MANTIDFYINNWIPKVYDRVPKAPNYQHSIMCDSLLGDASIGDDSRTKGYYERKIRLRIAYIAPSELFMLVNSFRGAAETKVQLVPPMGHSTFLIYIIPDNWVPLAPDRVASLPN